MLWGTPQEIETRRRIRLSIWAYAYEFMTHSIVSDSVYDVESFSVNLKIPTNRIDMDYWFWGNFNPYTGMWIHKHPELTRIASLYERFYK